MIDIIQPDIAKISLRKPRAYAKTPDNRIMANAIPSISVSPYSFF